MLQRTLAEANRVMRVDESTWCNAPWQKHGEQAGPVRSGDGGNGFPANKWRTTLHEYAANTKVKRGMARARAHRQRCSLPKTLDERHLEFQKSQQS